MDEFGLAWMEDNPKFLFTLREDDPDENKESTLNNGESPGSASQLSFTNLFVGQQLFRCTISSLWFRTAPHVAINLSFILSLMFILDKNVSC